MSKLQLAYTSALQKSRKSVSMHSRPVDNADNRGAENTRRFLAMEQ
jgi:hypothetical protein